jgi:hypothetical protein
MEPRSYSTLMKLIRPWGSCWEIAQANLGRLPTGFAGNIPRLELEVGQAIVNKWFKSIGSEFSGYR